MASASATTCRQKNVQKSGASGSLVAGVAVGDEDLLVAVVVQVVEQGGPGPARLVDTQGHTPFTPGAVAGRLREELVAAREHREPGLHLAADRPRQPHHPVPRVRVHVGQVDAPLARIVPVGQRHAHRVARVARQRVVVERLERAVAAVVPHEVAAEVVPLEQIQVAVAVEVEELRDVGIARPGDPAVVRLLGKPQSAVVDEKQVVCAVVGVDAVECLGAARAVGLVAAHEDVEPAVAVHVAGGHELRLVAPDPGRVVERQGARQIDPLAAAAGADSHPRPAVAIRHATPDDFLEAVTVEVHEQVLARNEQVVSGRQRLPDESAPPVVEEEDAVAGHLGGDDVPVAVPVPVHHAEGGIDQAHPGIGHCLTKLVVCG